MVFGKKLMHTSNVNSKYSSPMSKPIDLNKLIAEPTADDDSMVSRVVLRDVASKKLKAELPR